MIKTQIYFPEADLETLHETAQRTGRSVAELVREAVTEVWLRKSESHGPIGLWTEPTEQTSIEHDSIYDEP